MANNLISDSPRTTAGDMARDFSPLSRYAKREYKFVQGDSWNLIRSAIKDGKIPEDLDRGVCMGATLKWIGEKLSTSNSYFKPDGLLRGSAQREFANPINPVTRAAAGLSAPRNSVLSRAVAANSFLNRTFPKGKSHARNENTMLEAADVQETYSKTRSIEDACEGMNLMKAYYPVVDVWQDVPLQAAPGNSSDAASRRSSTSSHVRERDESATMSRAAHGLPPGFAILIELNDAIDISQRHAVAFYRSRQGEMGLGGKTLYFFDSNAGVYKISNDSEANIGNFTQAWLRVYEPNPQDSQGTGFRFKLTGNWCKAFKRRQV